MWRSKYGKGFLFAVVFAIPFFILGLITILVGATTLASAGFWTNLSLFSNVIAIFYYSYILVLWIIGRRDLEYDDIVNAATEGVIHHPDFQRVYNVLFGTPETPVEPTTPFGIQRVSETAERLRELDFNEIATEFDEISRLISGNFIVDAIIRTRRALELLFWGILTRRGYLDERRAYSTRWLIDRLTRERLIKTRERNALLDFWGVANRVVHGTMEPPDEDNTIAMIVTASEIAKIIAERERE